MSPNTWRRFSVLVACVLVAGPAARAVDGVLEINQACVPTGCFPGDGPGFPVEITQPGSYRLTGNLQVPDENTTAIEVNDAVRNVTIDLNGFMISGVTVCAADCSPQGPGVGIRGGSHARVTNGTVRSMGSFGLILGPFSQVEGVSAEQNGFEGISVGTGSRVVGCTAELNGSSGIKASGRASLVEGCAAIGNLLHGIEAASLTAVHNTADLNGGSGIYVSSQGLILGNQASGNDDFGLEVHSLAEAGYSDNNFSGNNGGNANPQVDGGTEFGSNFCGDDTTCP